MRPCSPPSLWSVRCAAAARSRLRPATSAGPAEGPHRRHRRRARAPASGKGRRPTRPAASSTSSPATMAKRFGLDRVQIKIVHFHRARRRPSGRRRPRHRSDHAHRRTRRRRSNSRLPTSIRADRGRSQRHRSPRPRQRPGTALGRGPLHHLRRSDRRLDRARSADPSLRRPARTARGPGLRPGRSGAVRPAARRRHRQRLRQGSWKRSPSFPNARRSRWRCRRAVHNRQAVDSAIRAFTADGTIEDLLSEWVGSDATEAESAIPLLHTTLH